MEFFEEYKKEAKEFDPELTHSEITMMYMNDYHPRLHDAYIRSLRPPTKRVRWTPTEVSYLKKNYPDIPIWKIAEKLKRSYKSVTSKIQALELRKDFNRIWYVQFLKHLKKQHPGLDTWSKLSIYQQVIKHVVLEISVIDVLYSLDLSVLLQFPELEVNLETQELKENREGMKKEKTKTRKRKKRGKGSRYFTYCFFFEIFLIIKTLVITRLPKTFRNVKLGVVVDEGSDVVVSSLVVVMVVIVVVVVVVLSSRLSAWKA